jgi:hypothetical protein
MPALMPPYTCYKCQKVIPYGEPVAFCNINMTGAANMSPSQCEPHCNDCSPFSLAAWQQSGDSGLTGSIAKELTAARGRVAALEKENAAVREQWSKQSETLSAMIQGRMAEASRASLAEEKLRKAEADRDALRAMKTEK